MKSAARFRPNRNSNCNSRCWDNSDTLRLSNRLVGPLVRIRDGLRRLVRGEHVAPIHFRTGDFMDEFATEFNKLSESLERKRLGVYEEPHQEEAAAV